ncbi:MAG: trigger factor, partial [Gemmatimonadetes bacterium]|nr:trigger factor [Gemmatimonadota bacterium]
MQTNVIETGKWERDLEIEVPAERMSKEMSSALRTYQKRLEVPGFRKGKVPLNLIEQRYGPAIRSGVIEDLLPKLLQEATQTAGINPAGTPRITKLEHEPGSALNFTASLDIWPEVELDSYEGLDISRVVHEITDDEMDEQLAELRNRQATERSVERALEKGDVLIADLQRLDDNGEPVEGDRYEERYFHVGNAEAPSPEFEEALVGINAGEERTIDFTYRDDLPNEELAGKEEHFLVTAREVRERSLPELDDEFAKDVGEQFENLDQLKDHVREQMTQRWDFMARQQMRGELMDGLLEKHEIEFPEGLIANYLESIRRERESQAQGQG